MAMPTHVSTGTRVDGTAATLSPTLPAGILAGQIILVHAFFHEGTTTTTGTWATPTGYALAARVNVTVAAAKKGEFAVFWKRADGTEGGTTVSMSRTGGTGNATVSTSNSTVWGDVVGSGNPWDVVATATDETPPYAFPQLITTGPDRRLVIWSFANDNLATHGGDASYTTLTNYVDPTGVDYAGYVAHKDAATAGTFNGSTTQSAGIEGALVHMALAPSIDPIAATFTADSVLRRIETATFVADSIIRRIQSSTFTADAVFDSSVTVVSGSFVADATIEPEWGSWSATWSGSVALGTISGSFTLDAILLRVGTSSITAEAVLKSTLSQIFTADAWFATTQTQTFPADSVLRKVVALAVSADAVLRATSTSSATANAVLSKQATATLTADAVFVSTSVGSFLANAVLRKETIASITSDSILRRTQSGTLSSDAIVRRVEPASLTADAFLQASSAVTFTANAILKAAGTFSFTADALIAEPNQVLRTFTAAAILRSGVSVQFAANSVLRGSTSLTVDASAVLRRVEGATWVASAILRTIPLANISSDAILRRVVADALTADSIIARTSVGTFTSDALLIIREVSAFMADASFRFIAINGFTADAVIVGLATGDIDATGEEVSSIVVTTDTSSTLVIYDTSMSAIDIPIEFHHTLQIEVSTERTA